MILKSVDSGGSYRNDRTPAPRRFDEVETTISHLFRKPHPALGGRSYGRALWHALTRRGLASTQVTEPGGGTGHIARAFCEAAAEEGKELSYRFIDLSETLLAAQRTAVPRCAQVRADGCALPFKDQSLTGLFLANEVIADLPVAAADERGAQGRLKKWGLELGSGTVNVGALELVAELARVLAPGAVACLTEFGGDFAPVPVRLEGRGGIGRHVEHSIHFGNLEMAARALGLRDERPLLADLLGVARQVRVASYLDCLRLRRIIPALPILAYPRDELVRAHPLLTRIFAFEFPEIGSPRFPDPQARGGFCQLFWALLLTQPQGR